MEPKWLKKSIKKSEVFLLDFGPIFGGFLEHFGGQNTNKNRVVNLVFFWNQKMSPGAACGDPRAAPGYLEASRHARGGAPGCGGKTDLRRFLAPLTPNNP